MTTKFSIKFVKLYVHRIIFFLKKIITLWPHHPLNFQNFSATKSFLIDPFCSLVCVIKLFEKKVQLLTSAPPQFFDIFWTKSFLIDPVCIIKIFEKIVTFWRQHPNISQIFGSLQPQQNTFFKL